MSGTFFRRDSDGNFEFRPAFGPFGFPPPPPGGRRGPGPVWRGRGGRGGGPGFRGPMRAPRGNVRAAILALLAERPMHGYEIIAELGERTDDMWRPSPGSVYPTLQMLEEEGLVTSEELEGKRRFSITDAGRQAVEARGGRPPWEEVKEGFAPGSHQLHQAMFNLVAAVTQVGRAGTASNREHAVAILDEARRKLYAMLAEEPSSES